MKTKWTSLYFIFFIFVGLFAQTNIDIDEKYGDFQTDLSWQQTVSISSMINDMSQIGKSFSFNDRLDPDLRLFIALARYIDSRNQTQSIVSLSEEEIEKYVESIKSLLLGGALDNVLDANENIDGVTTEDLKSFIFRTGQSKVYSSDFSGKRQKLRDALDTYNAYRSDIERLKTLIAEEKLLSPKQIFGTKNDGSDGMLSTLIAQRLDDDQDEFRSDLNAYLSDLDVVSVDFSWSGSDSSLESLIRMVEIIFSDPLFQEVADISKELLSQRASVWRANLRRKITPEEQVESIERIARNGYYDQEAENYFVRCDRFVNSIDNSVSANLRKRVKQSIEYYILNNDLVRDNYKSLISVLSRDVVPSEIFEDGSLYAFQWRDETGNAKFLSVNDEKRFVVSNTHMGDPKTHIKVVFDDNKVMFKSLLESSLVFSSKDNSFIEMDSSSPDEFKFFVMGSEDSFSAQSALTLGLSIHGGMLTVGLDGQLKTFSSLDNEAGIFPLINFDTDGNIEKTIRNTFKVFQISEFAQSLSALFDKRAQIESKLSANILEINWEDRVEDLIMGYVEIATRITDSTDDIIAFVEELIGFIDSVVSHQDLYSYLSTDSDLEESFSGVVKFCQDAFALEAPKGSKLSDKLNLLQTKWDNFSVIGFLEELPDQAPKNGDVIALQLENGKVLGVVEGFDATGIKKYYLAPVFDSKVDPATHLEVVTYGSLLGFKSKFAGDLMLAAVNVADDTRFFDNVRSLSSRLYFEPLARGDNDKQLPFESLENKPFHFIYEKNSKKFFYLKSSNNKQYVVDRGEDISVYKVDDELIKNQNLDNASKFKFTLVTDFHKQLGAASLQEDFERLTRYVSLVSLVSSGNDFLDFIEEVGRFIAEKKVSLESWQAFIGNKELVNLFDKVLGGLDSISKYVTDDDISDRYNEVKDFYERAFAEALDSFDGQEVVIRWSSAGGDKFLTYDNGRFSFTSDTTISDKVVFTVEVEEDTIDLKYGNKSVINELLKGSTFANRGIARLGFQGRVDGLSFFVPSDDSPLFLTAASKSNVSFKQGRSQGKDVPLERFQVFGMRRLSSLEEDLIEQIGSLDDLKTYNYDTRIISEDVSGILMAMIGTYSSHVSKMLDKGSVSLEDKFLLFREIKKFVLDVTSGNGNAYVDMISNSDLNQEFEDYIMEGLRDIASDNERLDKLYNEIKNVWEEGYIGSQDLVVGDIVAIKVKDLINDQESFLHAVETVYQGDRLVHLQAQPGNISSSAHFKLLTYKNRVGLEPLGFEGRLLSTDALSGGSSFKSLIMNRLMFTPMPIGEDRNVIDFGLPGTESHQLEYVPGAEDGSSASYLKSIKEDKNLVLLFEDDYFVGLAGDSTSDEASEFEFIPISKTLQMLSLAAELEDASEKFNIYNDIVTNRDLLTQADVLIYLREFSDFLRAIKSSVEAWRDFSQSQDNVQSLKGLIELLEEQQENFEDYPYGDQKIEAADIKKEILSLRKIYNSDITASLDNLDGQLVTIGWKDPRGDVYYLTFEDQGRGVQGREISLKKTDPLNRNAMFRLQKEGRSISLFYEEGEEESYGLSLDDRDYIIASLAGQAASLEAYGTEDKISFKSEDDVFLTVDSGEQRVKAEVSSNRSQANFARTVNGILQPLPSTQVFSISPVTKLSVALAEARNLGIGDRLDIYSIRANELNQNKAGFAEIELLLKEVSTFVEELTTSRDDFNRVQGDGNLTLSILGLFSNLESLVDWNEDLEKELLSIVESWDEGFVGEPSEFAPEDGDIVVIQPLNLGSETGQYLTFTEVGYQGQILYSLQALSNDLLDPNVRFKVKRYKNKFKLQPFVKDRLVLVSDPESENFDLEYDRPMTRIGFSNQAKDEDGNTVRFGSSFSQYYQWLLNDELLSEESSEVSFVIANAGTGDFLFVDKQDDNFVKRTGVLGSSGSPTRFKVISYGSLEKELMRIASFNTDQEIIEGFFNTVDQQYVQSPGDADVFVGAVKQYLSSKAESKEDWQKFWGNSENVKSIGSLQTKMSEDRFLEDRVLEIQKILNQGYTQTLKDGQVIQMFWKPFLGQEKMVIQALEENTDNKILKTVDREMFNLNSMFKVRYVDGKDNVVHLLSLDEQSVVLALSLDGNREVVQVFDFFGDPNILTRAESQFAYQGSIDSLSFFNIATEGFLTASRLDGTLSTYTDIAPFRPAGMMVNGTLIPSSFEEFKIRLMTEVDIDLFSYASGEDLTSSILDFMGFISKYNRIRGISLENSPEDREKLLDAVEFFVRRITSDFELSSSVEGEDDAFFEGLVSQLLGISTSTLEQERINSLLLLWRMGFLGEPHEMSPENGQRFAILQGFADFKEMTQSQVTEVGSIDGYDTSGKETIAPVTQRSSVKEPIVLAAINNKKLGNKLCLAKVDIESLPESIENFNDLVQVNEYVESFEKFLLANDPFAQEAIFEAVVNGNVIGIKSVFANDQYLTASEVDFSESYNDNKWTEACSTFETEDFWSNFDENSQHFSLEGDEQGKLLLKSQGLGSYLNISDDGFVRGYYRDPSSGEIQRIRSIVNLTDADSAEFNIVSFGDLHDLLLKARTADNKSKIGLYNQAIEKVEGFWDLKFLVDEVTRLIARAKASKSSWDNFIAAELYMKDLIALIVDILEIFQDDAGYFLNKHQVALLETQISYLSGANYPDFSFEIPVEATILSFGQQLNALQNKLNSLNESSVDDFIAGLENLLLRRVELDASNLSSIDMENLSFATRAVVKWLETRVMQNRIIESTGNQNIVRNLINLLNTDLSYRDYVDYLMDVQQNIPGFSEERLSIFMNVVLEAVSIENLFKARSEGFPINKLGNILSRVSANQLVPFLSMSPEFDLPVWMLDLGFDIRTLEDFMYYLVNNLSYPLVYGGEYVDGIEDIMKRMSDSADLSVENKLDLAGVLLSELLVWRTSLLSDEAQDAYENDPRRSSSDPKEIEESYIRLFYKKLEAFVQATLKSDRTYNVDLGDGDSRSLVERLEELLTDVAELIEEYPDDEAAGEQDSAPESSQTRSSNTIAASRKDSLVSNNSLRE